MKMSARSLFDTFFYIGMTIQEAFIQCERQGIFSSQEMDELKRELNL